jgi:putative transposase
MSRTVSPSSGKSYGLALVCRVWGTPRATVYRHRAPPRTEPAQRRGPAGPMSDAALLAAIRTVLAGSPFHGEGCECRLNTPQVCRLNFPQVS